MILSIIVPVYNLENYIAMTLDSLLAVHIDDGCEIIVINDGSTDASEKIIRSYQEKSSQIVLYTIENQGVSNARNFGLSKARGKYVTFVDGDDTVEPGFFAEAIDELEAGGYDFVQGNYKVVEGNASWDEQCVNKSEVITGRAVMFEKFFGEDKIIHNAVWGKVYRLDFIKSVNFDLTLRASEDQKFIFDLLSNADKIKLLNIHAINYFQRSTSAMHTFDMKKINDMVAVLDYCRDRASSEKIAAYTEREKQRILLFAYDHLPPEESETKEKVYKELAGFKFKSLKKNQSKKNVIRLWLLKYMRIVYDAYIKFRHRREHR